MLNNSINLENAILTGSYATEVDGNIIIRQGPNTEEICAYLENWM